MKRAYKILIIIIILYFSIGLLFTILRSNAHYNFFVVEEDQIENNGKTYWENRCVKKYQNNPYPNAQWCVDGSDEFKTEEPSRFDWYFHMFSKRPSDWFFAFFLWPLHFFGIDIINFRSIGNVGP